MWLPSEVQAGDLIELLQELLSAGSIVGFQRGPQSGDREGLIIDFESKSDACTALRAWADRLVEILDKTASAM